MVTDAQILTAAAEVRSCTKAWEDADRARKEACSKADLATAKLEECRSNLEKAQARLRSMAGQERAEPPPRPVVTLAASEPPKNLADGMAATSDADTPMKPRKGERRVQAS